MKLSLTLACGIYDRTLPLQNGSVRADGIDLNFLAMGPGDLFRRQGRHAEFDVAEFALSTYCILCGRDDRRMVAIPVFPSRKFRHTDIYINTRAGIRSPEDLIGKRVGAMEYQMTAAVWIRGLLQHDYNVAPDQVEWFFGGYNAPENYTARIPIKLSPSLRTKTISNQKCLNQMLNDGEIDALIGAHPPLSFVQSSPNVARLFPNNQEVEAEYYRKTGIFPMMHTVVIKRELYERAPWIAINLYNSFEKAKEVGISRLREAGTLFCALPWLLQNIEEVDTLMGNNPFSYGLQRNRKALDTFLQYCYEQSMTESLLTVEQLFVPETHST